MRQIYCADAECILLPSSKASNASEEVQVSSAASGGLNPEPSSSTIPLSQVTSKLRRKRKTRKNKKGKRVQTGSGKKRKHKSQRGGKRKKCVKKRK